MFSLQHNAQRIKNQIEILFCRFEKGELHGCKVDFCGIEQCAGTIRIGDGGGVNDRAFAIGSNLDKSAGEFTSGGQRQFIEAVGGAVDDTGIQFPVGTVIEQEPDIGCGFGDRQRQRAAGNVTEKFPELPGAVKRTEEPAADITERGDDGKSFPGFIFPDEQTGGDFLLQIVLDIRP